MKIKHIIITKFNVDFLNRVKIGPTVSFDSWLEKRKSLFFSYCYPSLISQTDGQFEWWVFFDPATPKEFLGEIKKMDVGDIIKIKYSSLWAELNQDILRYVSEIKEDYDILIQSRIDGDDGYSLRAIEQFKNNVSFLISQPKIEFPFIINPVKGFILDAQNRVFYKREMSNNPFISMVLKRGGISATVFKYQHTDFHKFFKVFNLNEGFYWIQVIHGGNLLNKITGKPILFKSSNFISDFRYLEQNFNFLYLKNYLSSLPAYFSRRFKNLQKKINLNF